VGTPPKIHPEEVARAIERIVNRRVKVDRQGLADVHLDRLPDSPDSDPRDVLHYLRRFSGEDIPRWVLQADVCDALTLTNWLWWEDRRLELYFLTEGVRRRLPLSQLGAQVGVGKQGVRDRMDRLQALLRYDRPDEQLTRAARAAARTAERRRSVEDRWLTEHRHRLLTVIEDLVAEADRYELADEDREWIDELAIDARNDGFTRTIMPLLGLASDELRTAQAVVTLHRARPPHRVHTVLEHADTLRSSFAALGASTQAGKKPA
jgi:hypothetical protein